MKLILRQSLSQTQKQTLVLSYRVEQKQTQEIEAWLQLVQDIRGEKYKVEEECNHCHKKMSPAQILHGFLSDVNDFTTVCIYCKRRFETNIFCTDRFGNKKYVPLLCQAQCLHKLKKIGVISPDDFENVTGEDVGVYRSLIFHFGSLHTAYKQINVKYDFPPPPDWKEKSLPFLGKIEDQHIADVMGVTKKEVMEYRKSKNILFRRRKTSADYV